MKNELQRHKRSDKIKWAFTGIAFVLLFVMIVGLCLQIFGTGNVKPSEWFKKAETEQTEELPEDGENDGGADETAAVSFTSLLSSTRTSDNVMSTYANDYETEILNSFLDDGYSVTEVSYSEVTNAGLSFTLTNSITDDTCSLSDIYGVKYYHLDVGSMQMYFVFILKDINPFSYRVAGLEDSIVDSVSFYNADGVDYNDSIEELELYYYKLSVAANGSYVIQYNLNLDKTPVSLPDDPVKEGYTFIGWYYDEAYTQPYDGETIYEDTVLYAKFEINHYTVTFISDGGSVVESQTVEWNTSLTLPITTRIGYVFKGWYFSDGTEYTGQGITADISLTAYWDVQMCTVTFYVGGKVYQTLTVEYGTSLVSAASKLNLNVKSVYSESGALNIDDDGTVIVSGNCSVEAVEMSTEDQIINTLSENKWAIIGGVIGGVVLIAVVSAICGAVKRKGK